MASQREKLAESLEALERLQEGGIVAIRSGALGRTHRERLLRAGFLHKVMRGWYIPSRPDEPRGESTAWYASFWRFCAAYLAVRLGDDWSLSPEQSLLLQSGNHSVPRQLLVRAPKGRNNVTRLPHGTSLLETRASLPGDDHKILRDGLRLFSVPAALVACGIGFFRQQGTDARASLAMVRDASEVLAPLLAGGRVTAAGRLAGGFRNICRPRIADEIVATMKAVGYDVRECDPFEDRPPALSFTQGGPSPYVNRVRLMWHEMREAVPERFPQAPGVPENSAAYLKTVDEVYVSDAYHSLSIEGYRVSRGLVERVRSGPWDPENDADDHERRDALAARGYYDAFQEVRKSVALVLGGEDPGSVADETHGDWYRALFAPSVAAGIVQAADLAGYRNGQVFIRRSMHVPPPRDAVRDLMPALFDLIREEPEPSVRVVLSHFVFVYIHPYVDGNGRMGRFLMNVMLAAGGYPWVIVPVEKRHDYMVALESASVDRTIVPFTDFLGKLVRDGMAGKPWPEVPSA